MKKRLLAVLLVLVLAAGMLPVTAGAVDNYDVWVGGIKVTAGTAGDLASGNSAITVTSGGSVSYDADAATLTLHNATIDIGAVYTARVGGSTRDRGAAIYTPFSNGVDLTIVLVGENTLIGYPYTDSGTVAFGIEGGYRLTIQGSGSLTVYSHDAVNDAQPDRAYAIYCNGPMCFGENCTVTAEAKSANSESIGVRDPSDNLEIGANVTLTAIGETKAMKKYEDQAPDLGDGLRGVASTSTDGSSPVTYVPANIATYKYLKFAKFHQHSVSTSCSTSEGTQETFRAITSASQFTNDMAAGCYYLDDKVNGLGFTLSSNWSPTNDIVLCLNGYMLEVPDSCTIRPQASLTICDCGTHALNYVNDARDGKNRTITSGVITGHTKSAVTLLSSGASFTMYGGAVAGCSASAVYVNTGATFNMHGGLIAYNSGDSAGGVNVSGTVNMDGGTIANNHSGSGSWQAGGVLLFGGTLNMSGGSIVNNTAASGGGGVYLPAKTCTLNLSGTPVIKDNTVDGNANNVYLLNGVNQVVVNITAALSEGADVHITAQTWPSSSGSPISLGNDDTYSSGYLTADSANDEIVTDDEGVMAIKKKAPTTYTVTFAGGTGATGTAPTQAATAAGGTFALPANTFTKTGYTFAGWSDGTTTYAAGATYTMPAGNVTFTAQWTAITYTVTFDANGGTGTMTAVTKNSGDAYALPACTFTAPDGKQFKAWQVGADTTERAAGYSITVSADVTIKAIWEDAPAAPPTPTETYTPPTYSATVPQAPDHGAVEISRRNASKNTTVTVTVTPDRKYKTKTVVITDRAGNEVEYTEDGGKYTFKMPASQVNVKAEFVWDNPFVDVAENAWFHDDVEFCHVRDMMDGVDEATFAPTVVSTRGMVMTMLARLEGVDTDQGDVWYEKGLEWAVENEISDGALPEDSLTREQLVVMLYRYAKLKGLDLAVDPDVNFLSWDDALDLSPWAREAMFWAIDRGIIKGKGGPVLDPLGTATRAEIAAIFNRYLSLDA